MFAHHPLVRSPRFQPRPRSFFAVRRYAVFLLLLLCFAPTFTAKAQTPPSVTDLTATPGYWENYLSWTWRPSVLYATIYVADNSGGPYWWHDTVYRGSGAVIGYYTDWGVESGRTKYYVITLSYDFSQEGPYSNQASATPYGIPAAVRDLVATSGTGQITLAWEAGLSATGYNVKRQSTNGVYETIAANIPGTSYTDMGLTDGTSYYYKVSALNSYGESANSYAVSAIPQPSPPSAPANLIAVSTGSGKITLYWENVSNATGYNIYRGTTAGGEDYANPVNGATQVNHPGYSGSTVHMFTDTGLTNGVEYFYTIKAVNSTGASNTSNEANAIPDPLGIPWDSPFPWEVLDAVRAHYQNDPNSLDFGEFRVAGPDGQIYEDGQIQVLAPDGVGIQGTNSVQMSDGTVMMFQRRPQPDALEASDGPYRRVRTTASFRGTRGYFRLPVASDVNRTAEGEDIYMYLGSSSNTVEVDAGLQWSQDRQTGVKNGWNSYITSSPRGRLIVNRPSVGRFDVDQEVWVIYLPRTIDPDASMDTVSLVTIEGSDTDGNLLRRTLGVFSRHAPNELVRSKRVHSIAQGQTGLPRNGTYVQNVEWREGQVRDASGNWNGWTGGITNENGSYPLDSSIVDWYTPAPFQREINIKLNLR